MGELDPYDPRPRKKLILGGNRRKGIEDEGYMNP